MDLAYSFTALSFNNTKEFANNSFTYSCERLYLFRIHGFFYRTVCYEILVKYCAVEIFATCNNHL